MDVIIVPRRFNKAMTSQYAYGNNSAGKFKLALSHDGGTKLENAGVALLGGYDPSSLLHTLPEM